VVDDSKQSLRDADRHIVWHPFTQMQEYEPLILTRGEGCTLWDIDGHAYLDGVSSMWCNVHGHRHPRIDQAIREQLDQVAHVTALGASNPPAIRLAQRLVEIAPPGLEHVFFSDDGATAIEVAIKMSLQYWRQCERPRPEKTRYVALADAYHGDTLGSVSVGGVDPFTKLFAPLCFEPFRLPLPDMYRLPQGVKCEGALAHYVKQAEALLAVHHQKVAAVIVEPLVQCAAGMVMHPSGYLAALRELTKKYDVLLIADEVAVGFGRTGTIFACEQEQVTPDLLCLAKGITGGYLPLAATLAKSEIYRAFLGEYSEWRQFCHGHTYGGNPLGAAAALATLDIFEKEQTLTQLPAKSARIAEHLTRIAQYPHVGDVRQRGMIAGIELVADKPSQRGYPLAEKRGYKACDVARAQGVLLRPLGNVLVIMPPLSVSLDEIDRIMLAAQAGIQVATA
jgi:adenosylmethionine-8-amino-7-oxononanoate aminotransferase